MNQPSHNSADDAAAQSIPSHRPEAAEACEVLSEELLAGKSEVLIRHGDEIYRLRLTRNGKLILQK
jgi:hemin uptake protein HemP